MEPGRVDWNATKKFKKNGTLEKGAEHKSKGGQEEVREDGKLKKCAVYREEDGKKKLVYVANLPQPEEPKWNFKKK